MFFRDHSKKRDVLTGELFNFYRDFFFNLPEKFFFKLDLNSRILVWEEKQRYRENKYCSLGNLCWTDSDYNVFKWQLVGSGDNETSESTSSSQNKNKALRMAHNADISDLLSLVKDEKWHSIRQCTHDFNNAYMIFIVLNSLAFDTNGFYHYDVKDIDYVFKEKIAKKTSLEDFTAQYNSLHVPKNEYSRDVLDYVLSLDYFPNVSDFYYKRITPKHLR